MIDIKLIVAEVARSAAVENEVRTVGRMHNTSGYSTTPSHGTNAERFHCYIA